MKKGLLVLAAALLAGVAAFYATRWHVAGEHHDGGHAMMDAMPELEWLQRDLHLSEAQFAKVSELHAAYRPQCTEMCQHIARAHEKMESIAQVSGGMTPELQAALKEHADLHLECQQTMLQHLYRTAATLDQGQSQQYLKTMLPFALDFSRSEPEQPDAH